MARLRTKRVHEAPSADDGVRLLVDRLWPRGISRQRAAFDDWVPDVAPSTALRRWYGHDPARFPEFAARYRAELDASEAAAALRRRAGELDVVTLVHAAKDAEHSNARVLREWLEEQGPAPRRRT